MATATTCGRSDATARRKVTNRCRRQPSTKETAHNPQRRLAIACRVSGCFRRSQAALISFLASIASHAAASIFSVLTSLDGSRGEPIGAGRFLFAGEAPHRARRGAPVALIDVHAGAKAARRAPGRPRIDDHLPRPGCKLIAFRRFANRARFPGAVDGQGRFPGPFFWVFRDDVLA